MGWSVGYDERWRREIGDGVPALCDHPGCDEERDRGPSFVCGNDPYGGDRACGLYERTDLSWADLRRENGVPEPPALPTNAGTSNL